jgi:hypothetical protein
MVTPLLKNSLATGLHKIVSLSCILYGYETFSREQGIGGEFIDELGYYQLVEKDYPP